MKRPTLNFIVDLIALIDLIAMTATGFILIHALPPGSGGCGAQLHDGQGREHIKALWSMSRHQWGTVHYCLALLFIVLMVIHIVLHWTWIKTYLKSAKTS
jgi:hypothetical protein